MSNNVHPLLRSWNSSNDFKVGSTSRNLHHSRIGCSKEFIVSHANTLVCAFTRYKFTIKHNVYLDIGIFLQHISHTIKHNFTRIFEKLTRFDVLEVYYSISQYTFEVSISRHLNLYPAPACTKRPRTESFKFSIRAIRATNDCLTLIDDRGRLIRLCLSSDSMNSSKHCSYARYSSRVFNWVACSCKSRSVYSILPLWTACHY